MARPVFVVVDAEPEYVRTLESHLVQAFGTDADLHFFDEYNAVQQFLQQEPHVDLLVISERVFEPRWRKTGAGTVIVLTDDKQDKGTREDGLTYIYKYAAPQKIFAEIEYAAGRFVNAAEKDGHRTKTVLVYSAAGGAGKTAVAVSLCACLAEGHKKVLYMDAENLQDFGYYLQEKTCMAAAAVRVLSQPENNLYEGIRLYLNNQGFDYFPPLRMAASSMGIDVSVYAKAAAEFSRHAEYDYIIIDTDSLFDERKDALIQQADRVIILFNPTKQSVYKTQKLLENITVPENGKFLFVCSRCTDAQAAAEVQHAVGHLDAAVCELPSLADGVLPVGCEDIEKISYLL